MPASVFLNIEQFQEFARPLVESGRYASADAVMSAAIEALRREEYDDPAKLAISARRLRMAWRAASQRGM